MSAAMHRRARLVWLAFAAVELIIALGGLRWPWLNIYVAPAGAWVWCMVGAAYHHGHLRALGRETAAVERLRAERDAMAPVVAAAITMATADPVWPDGLPWDEFHDTVRAYTRPATSNGGAA